MGHAEPPTALRVAVAAWLVAIGAGLLETALVLATGTGGPDVVDGVVVRCLAFGAATVVVLRLRARRRWARTTLAGTERLFALSRGLHVVAVVTAVTAMYLPASSRFLTVSARTVRPRVR